MAFASRRHRPGAVGHHFDRRAGFLFDRTRHALDRLAPHDRRTCARTRRVPRRQRPDAPASPAAWPSRDGTRAPPGVLMSAARSPRMMAVKCVSSSRAQRRTVRSRVQPRAATADEADQCDRDAGDQTRAQMPPRRWCRPHGRSRSADRPARDRCRRPPGTCGGACFSNSVLSCSGLAAPRQSEGRVDDLAHQGGVLFVELRRPAARCSGGQLAGAIGAPQLVDLCSCWREPAGSRSPSTCSARRTAAERDGHLRDVVPVVANAVDDRAKLVHRDQIVVIDMAQRVVRGGHAAEAEPADHEDRQRARRPSPPAAVPSPTAPSRPAEASAPARHQLAVGQGDALGVAGADGGIGAFGAWRSARASASSGSRCSRSPRRSRPPGVTLARTQ